MCRLSGFQDMTLTNVSEMAFFPPMQHIKTIVTLVLLGVTGVESWLIDLFIALA